MSSIFHKIRDLSSEEDNKKRAPFEISKSIIFKIKLNNLLI